jgi:phospholipase/carboxylesterase
MAANAYSHHAEKGRPGAALMFLFHGTGGDENQFLGLGRELLPGASIVAPRGDISEQGASRFFRRTSEGVYDMDDLARATQKMAGFVRAHAESAKAGAVLGLGYSNGANILASVLFGEPDLFDAVVLMHPLIPFQPRIKGSLAGKRILITAGEKDPICPPSLTGRLAAWLEDGGGDITLEWHSGGHEARPSEIEAARRFLGAYHNLGAQT